MGKEQSQRQDHKQDGSPRTEKTDPSAQRMRAYQNWRAVVPGPHLRTPEELLFYESDILIGPDITYRIKADEESDPPTEDEIRTWVQKNLASAGLLALDLARVEADIRNAVMTLRQDPAARARLRELLDRLDQTSSRSEKRELGVYPPSIESPTRTPQGLTDHESADDQIPSPPARPQVPPHTSGAHNPPRSRHRVRPFPEAPDETGQKGENRWATGRRVVLHNSRSSSLLHRERAAPETRSYEVCAT